MIGPNPSFQHGRRWATRAVGAMPTTRNTRPSPLNCAPTACTGSFAIFAAIYCANHQSCLLETALRKAQIPAAVSADKAFRPRRKSRGSGVRGFACWPTRMIDPAFCAPSPAPSAVSAHHAHATGHICQPVQNQPVWRRCFRPLLPTALPKRGSGWPCTALAAT